MPRIKLNYLLFTQILFYLFILPQLLHHLQNYLQIKLNNNIFILLPLFAL
jgi:hypothetical protein